MSDAPRTIPDEVKIAKVDYRVPFVDTDAMGVVHHSHYFRYYEIARTHYLETHDQPYHDYVEIGLHAAVHRVDALYVLPLEFDDRIEITCWLRWVKHVSLAFAYVIQRGDDFIASAITEHTMISPQGRPARIPKNNRFRLQSLAAKRH